MGIRQRQEEWIGDLEEKVNDVQDELKDLRRIVKWSAPKHRVRYHLPIVYGIGGAIVAEAGNLLYSILRS